MEPVSSARNFVVTGATSGIGFATAQRLVREGHAVIGVGRSPERCREALRRLCSANPNGQVEFCLADFSSQSQVRQAARQIASILAKRGVKSLDGLVNNAGTVHFRYTPSPDGIELTWAVNHLAPFLLTRELMPLLQAAPYARVVTVSSNSHYGARIHWRDVQLRRFYFIFTAYRQSKLANILFTHELNRRYGLDSHLRAFAADPGLVKTGIASKGTPLVVRWIWNTLSRKGTLPETAGAAIAFLVCEPSIQNRSEVYWKDCAPKTPASQAMDLDAAKRLWALSESMLFMPDQDEEI